MKQGPSFFYHFQYFYPSLPAINWYLPKTKNYACKATGGYKNIKAAGQVFC